MSAAAIDVLVPVFNAAATLDESFASLAAQSFADFRVVAVDDGSTDGSGALLAAWAARDPRFTVLTKPNGGIVDALNLGLRAVTAPLVARLDGDDICLPDRFARQSAYLQAHPDCVAVGCGVEHIDGDGRLLSGFPQPGQPDGADMDWLPAREPYIVHPFLMARSAALSEVGGYRRVPHSEDSDLFWRLAERGRLYNLPDILGRYRMHLDSISGSSIVNGRVMAIGSQLGALSARRRRAGQPDLSFDRDLVGELKSAGELEDMCRVVAAMVTPADMPLFRLGAGIKLLELADYRPYEIERGDCAFIAAAWDAARSATRPGNVADMKWYVTRTGGRLLRQGRLRDAMRLVPPALWPVATARGVLVR